MSKIIVIENQMTQFLSLRTGLVTNDVASSEDIFPKEKEWKSFMNHIKIAINKDYDYIETGEYRRIAKTKIFEIIQAFKPDLLIIDYLLGGTTCEKGVKLAKEIVKGVKKPNPQFSIVFLSREQPSDDDYDRFRQEFNNKIYIDWLSKSYSHDKILEDKYLSEVLCEDIKAILKDNDVGEWEKYIEKYNAFLTKDQRSSINKIIEKRKKGEPIDEQYINLLKSLILRGNNPKISEDENAILLSVD